MQGSKVGRVSHTRASKAMVAILDSHSRATGSLSRAMGSHSMAMGSLLGAALDLPQVDAPSYVRSHLRSMIVNTPFGHCAAASGRYYASLSLILWYSC